MNWLSKKIIVNKLKGYFNIENESNIQISLWGNKELKFSNLSLKPEKINSPSSLIHIQHCQISKLEITFDRMLDSPLRVNVDKLDLVLKFNKNLTEEKKKSEKKVREELDKFYEAVSTESEFQERNFIQEQIFQLTRMLKQFFLKKLSLTITNIDVCVEYGQKSKLKYFGVEIAEIKLIERVVINHSRSNEYKSEELNCIFDSIWIYLGLNVEENVVKQEARHRQIVRKKSFKKKKYLMEDNRINAFYSIEQNRLSIQTKEIMLKVSKILFYEVGVFLNYVKPLLESKLHLRPGEGKKILLQNKFALTGNQKLYDQQMRVSEGTIQWWQKIGNKIIHKIQAKENMNILKNKKFKKYLYCLLYRYTFGAESELEKIIQGYEFFKKSQQIMKYHRFILQKIDRIQTTKGVIDELKGFIIFLRSVVKADETLKGLKLKKIQYENVKNSPIIINLKNCEQFLELYETKMRDQLTINIELKTIKFEVVTSAFLKKLLKEFQGTNPLDYKNFKNETLDYYCQQIILQDKKEIDELSDFTIELNEFFFEMNDQGNLYIGTNQFQIYDSIRQMKIALLRKLMISHENLRPEEYKWAIIAEAQLTLEIQLLHFHLEHKFMGNLLLIKNFIEVQDQSEDKPEQEEETFIKKFMKQKIPRHPIFNSYSKTSKKLKISELYISTPVMDKDRILEIDLNDVNYHDPVGEKYNFEIKNFTVMGTTEENLEAKVTKNYKKQKNITESIILANNRPFSCYSFEKNSQHITSILLPFILVQISCQDIYYFWNIMKLWTSLFKNKFFFLPKENQKKKVKEKINPTSIQFTSKMQKIIVFKSILDLKMEGIQFVLVADQINTNSDGRNKIMEIMIDTVLFRKEAKYAEQNIEIMVKDIYAHNTLGNKKINKETLVKSVKRTLAYDDESILIRNEEIPSSEGELIFYSDASGREQKKSFIEIEMKSFVNLIKMKKENQVQVNILPIFIFHCPQFFETLMLIINITKSLSEETISSLPIQAFYENQFILEEKPSEHQILVSSQFLETTRVQCLIQKVNILIIKQPHIVYTFSIDQFSLNYITEPYLKKINFQMRKVSVVDTSPEAGPYPIIMESKQPVLGSLTMYDSWLLQEKHKMASLLNINIEEAKVFFLKKKIMELTNFILGTMKEVFPDEKKNNQKNQRQNEPEYGFCYNIELIRPRILLLRGSLSTEGFRSLSEKIVVRNFPQEIMVEERFTEKANISIDEDNEDYFESCSQLDQDSFEFQSFRKDESIIRSNKKIFIEIVGFTMFGERKNRKKEEILKMKHIQVEFESPQLILNIPELEMDINEDDYRVLIRITEQNLGQSPILFLNKSPPKPEVQLSFKTVFVIQKILMRTYTDKLIQSEKLFELQMNLLRGTNVILTDGENQTEFMIYEVIARTKTGNLVMANKKFQKYTQKLSNIHSKKKNINFKDISIFDVIEKQNKKVQKQIHENEHKIKELMKHSHLQQGKVRAGQRQETNSQKICRWFKGMCMKCCCCCCCCEEQEMDRGEMRDIFGVITKKKIENGDILSTKDYEEGEGNYDSFTIHDYENILPVKSKINPEHIKAHQNEPEQQSNMIYLDFLMKPWGEKHMYMLVKNLAIILEREKALNSMIAFFYKPYQFPQIPEYFKFPKFNNFRPFKMLIKLTNSVCEMINHKSNNEEDKILIALEAIYDSQKRGDTTKGPGLSNVKIETLLKFLFVNDYFSKPISLSDSIQVLYTTEQTVPFDEALRTKSKQKIIIFPSNHSKKVISLHIPVYLIKSIQKVFTSSFSSKGQEQNVRQSSGQRMKREEMVEVKKEEEKKKPQIYSKDSTVNRSIYVPEIKFEIQSKCENTFLSAIIKNTQVGEIVLNNGPQTNITYRNLKSSIQINYWNLKLAKFEPFLEPWKFKLSQVVNKREEVVGSNLKLSSDFDDWNLNGKYINDMNVNISTAFFHTVKELQIKYEQEDMDEEEICFDLTSSTDSDYKNLFAESGKLIAGSMYQRMEKFPQQLKIFFGRQFIIEGDLKNKKNHEIFDKQIFNPSFLRIFLYHSYFDHMRRRKRIVYRTPLRIFNSTRKNFTLLFYSPKLRREWKINLLKLQYYAIPNEIYHVDFLVKINEKKEFDKMEKKDVDFLSVSYLMQLKAKKKNYILLKNDTKIWKQVFKYSSLHDKNKFIDRRDMVIKSGDFTFTIISIKSEYQKSLQMKKKNSMYEEDIKLYDSFSLIFSPIVIYNYTHLPFTLKVHNKLKLTLKSNEKLQINESLPKNIYDTVIEFEEDSLHEEFKFLSFPLGRHEKSMEIQKLQSINMVINRQTNSTCFIELYGQWNITNYTNEEFCLTYDKKIFLIDKASFSCLSDISAKSLYISIIGEKEKQEKITVSNILDNFVLAKKIDPELHQELELNRLEYEEDNCCSCVKKMESYYENIEFVLNSEDDPLYPPISKRVQIKYKYQISNQTSTDIELFQYNNRFSIAKLMPDQTKYIFYYNFIPQIFLLRTTVDDKNLESCGFELYNFPGKSFALKFRKQNAESEYHLKFHYLRVEVKKIGEESLIQIEDADFQDFPIYLDNVTDYNIKITQSEESFMLKPQQRIPFTWSLLMTTEHKLEVEIEGCPPKIYYLNQKSEFEPIKIMDKTRKVVMQQPQALYLKEVCRIYCQYLDIEGVFQVILDLFDNKLRIYNELDDFSQQINMDEAFKIDTLAQRIEIYFPNNKIIEITPSPKTFKRWDKELRYSINRDVVDKVFFTIESYKNSRICFLRSLTENDYESTKRQFSIGYFNLSLINSKPEEVILIYAGGITYSQHYRSHKLNYKSLQSRRSEHVVTMKKFRISNQLKGAVNPVVLSRIKKSQTPFLEVRLMKENIMKKNQIVDENIEQIIHYKQIAFFLDEAQLMIEAALFFQLLDMKASFDGIKNQYAVGFSASEGSAKLVLFEEEKKPAYNPQVYINTLDLKPLKMTISVYLEHNENQDIKLDAISILRYIPFGVENAIIKIDSYLYFHIFYDQRQLTNSLVKYYMRSIRNQVLVNAGSYDMFVPIQLVQGLGVGVKNIFYDPIYEFVQKKEIKAVTKTCLEGLISLIVFLLSFFIKIINLIFKFLAAITFDTEFKTKREMFRKQIFKSPMDGLVYGLRYTWRVFTSFLNMLRKPDKNSKITFETLCMSILTAMRVTAWVFKLVVTFYDLLYVIGLGLVNWGYYEESAMQKRSRPPRVFPQKQLIPYNYLHSHGNELIGKYQMESIEKEEIYFVNPLYVNDENNYIILSNYRILYNSSSFTGCQEIKLFQIGSVVATEKNNKILIKLRLSVGNRTKVLFCSCLKNEYEINFIFIGAARQFLIKLKSLCKSQNLNIDFEEPENLKTEVQGEKLLSEVFV